MQLSFQVTLILTWVIDSPISPESWLMSLLFVVIITMIKQGYEDYLRSFFIKHDDHWPMTLGRAMCPKGQLPSYFWFDQLPLKRPSGRPQQLFQLFKPKTNHFILPLIGSDYQACLSKVIVMFALNMLHPVICKLCNMDKKLYCSLAPVYWCQTCKMFYKEQNI